MTQNRFLYEIEAACRDAEAGGLSECDVSFLLHTVAAEFASLHIPVEDRLLESVPDLKSVFGR